MTPTPTERPRDMAALESADHDRFQRRLIKYEDIKVIMGRSLREVKTCPWDSWKPNRDLV